MRKILLLLFLFPAVAFAETVGVGDSASPNHQLLLETHNGNSTQMVEVAGQGGVSTWTVTNGAGYVYMASTGTVGTSSGTAVNINGLVVSSGAVPFPYGDGKIQNQLGDNMGRTLVSGCPFGITVSSYATGISTITLHNGVALEGVLFSSGTGTNPYFYLAGCEFHNMVSSGTVIIESPANTLTSRRPIAVTAAPSPPEGIAINCQNPTWRSAPFTDTWIYIKATTVSDQGDMYCVGYYGP